MKAHQLVRKKSEELFEKQEPRMGRLEDRAQN